MIYQNEALANTSFPLGGIGTGCIGLLGNGELSDFEITPENTEDCAAFERTAIAKTPVATAK